jgi:hypothetical protein
MKNYMIPTVFVLVLFMFITACKKEESGDNNKPFIVLIGNSSIIWPQWNDPYVDQGAEAFDITESGDTVNISNRLQYQDNVDPNVMGDYTARYNVTDEAGNAADEQVRNVRVLPTK